MRSAIRLALVCVMLAGPTAFAGKAIRARAPELPGNVTAMAEIASFNSLEKGIK